MAERRFLVLPPAQPLADRARRSAGGSPFRFPPRDRQRERLTPQFDALEQLWDARRPEIETSPIGLIPEQVVVLETVGSIADFQNAVRRIPGMEWLVEWDEDDLPADDDFSRTNRSRPTVDGRLYLIVANQTAMGELLSLWRRFQREDQPTWERGRTKWRDLFSQLRQVRPWDTHDRLDGTGMLEEWTARVAEGRERFRAEVELWFRESPEAQQQSASQVRRIIEQDGGQVLSEARIDGARYLGLLADLPISALSAAFDSPATRLVGAQDVMFLRPVGQSAVVIPTDQPLGPVSRAPGPLPSDDPPLVALFDGLPLANHIRLADRLIIDDPDSFETMYLATERVHGTAMASLIVHGELDASGEPLRRRLYVRPVMRPEGPEWRGHPHSERIPSDMLPVDLIHRAVRRLFEASDEGPPVAPSVRVINWSIGDPSRPFDRLPSSLARVLDWLSERYNVLFVVSAGNHPFRELEYGCDDPSFRALSPAELEKRTFRIVEQDTAYRRILAPAESVNALTVGALHADRSSFTPASDVFDVYCSPDMPSPISGIGPGVRRGVKPDLLAPGGRQLFQTLAGSGDGVTLESVLNPVEPGHRVAAPGRPASVLDATRYVRGSSNAAALTTRTAAQVAEVLERIRAELGSEAWDDAYVPLLIRTLVVHGCSWGTAAELLTEVFREKGYRQPKEFVPRHLGYGVLDPARSLAASDERAVLLGWNAIEKDTAYLHALPLPPSLASRTDWRRLTVTLAWFSPINAAHRAYRRAHLWFTAPDGPLAVDRTESHALMVQRGTLQHEVFEGEGASAFLDGDEIRVQVNCREDGGAFVGPIRYALALSLEVREGIQLPIFQEIEARVQLRVQPARVRVP